MVSPSRIPLLGGTIYHAGQVYNMLSVPCTPEPVVAVYAFFQYAPMIVWSLVKPDPVDYMFDRWGRRHKKRRKQKFLMADIDIDQEWYGKGLGWALWKTAAMAQRAGMYFLIVDATVDFAVNWTSMTYAFSGCRTPENPWGQITCQDPQTYRGLNELVTLVRALQRYENIWHTESSLIAANTWGPKTYSAAVEFGLFTGPDKGEVQKVVIEAHHVSGTGYNEMSLSEPDHEGKRYARGSVRVYSDSYQPVTIRVRFIATSGWVLVNNWSLSAAGGTDDNFLEDP